MSKKTKDNIKTKKEKELISNLISETFGEEKDEDIIEQAKDIYENTPIMSEGERVAKIPLKYLVIPNEDGKPNQYQRKDGKALKMAEKFDVRLCGVILVSYRNGRFYVVEGHNRCIAALLSGKKRILCFIIKFEGTDDEIAKQEAELFTMQAPDTKSLSPYDAYRAAVISGLGTTPENKARIEVHKIFEEEQNIPVQKKKEVGCLHSLSAPVSIALKNPDILRWAVSIIKNVKYDRYENAYSDKILRAMDHTYTFYKDEPKLTEAVTQILEEAQTPIGLGTAANSYYGGDKNDIRNALRNYMKERVGYIINPHSRTFTPVEVNIIDKVPAERRIITNAYTNKVSNNRKKENSDQKFTK